MGKNKGGQRSGVISIEKLLTMTLGELCDLAMALDYEVAEQRNVFWLTCGIIDAKTGQEGQLFQLCGAAHAHGNALACRVLEDIKARIPQ